MAALLGGMYPGSAHAGAEVETELEAAVVAATRNDVRIPGNAGTSFSLVDDLSARAGPAFRVRAGVRIAERHLVSALYAPLRLSANGNPDRDIAFAGAEFRAGSPVYAVYRFDSYRLTYRYSFVSCRCSTCNIEWRPGRGSWGVLLDADALAAPQGRAEDVLVALTWAARDGVGIYAGYRTLEGGADNDEAYNFAWLHYGAVGVRLRL